MNNKKQIKLGAILSYVSIAINIIAGVIYTPWMINQIGQNDYGLYTLANSLITLFLVDFGLGSAVSRYISKYRAEGDEERIERFLGIVYKLYLIIDAIIFVALAIVFLLIDRIYVNLTPTELEKFKIVYLISASFAVLNFPFVTLNGILASYEKFIQQKLADVIYRVLIIALTVLTLLSGGGLYALVISHVLSGVLVALYKLACVKKIASVKIDFKYFDKKFCKDIFGFSFWVTVSLLAQRLIFNITPSILGIVASSGAIAVFGIVTTVEGYSYTFTSAINGMFMPRISRIYLDDNPEDKIMPLMLTVGKFQYALNGLIVSGFAVLGKTFIQLWMGPDYMDAYVGILLVIIPGLFYNSLQIANTVILVQNKVNYQAYITVTTGIVNVVLSFVLSSIYGVIGACVSIFIAYMIRAILTNVVLKTKLHIDISTFAQKCYLKMSIPVLITVALGLLITKFTKVYSWISFFVCVAIIFVIYSLLVFLFGLDRNERSNIISLIFRRSKL